MISVASSAGVVSAFFEPSAECLARDAEGSGDASHTRAFLVGADDLLLESFIVAIVRIL